MTTRQIATSAAVGLQACALSYPTRQAAKTFKDIVQASEEKNNTRQTFKKLQKAVENSTG